MKIQQSSELMRNQKQASVMAPDSFFQVFETYDGHSLFFSLGSDDVFYLTRELDRGTTGWTRSDLSSGLNIYHGGKTVRAKNFAVAQNPQGGGVDIALAVSVEGVDYLYISLGNSDKDLFWADHIGWLIMPFDDPDHKVPVLEISGIYISQSGGREFILADILRSPGSSLNYIDRYAVDPSRANGQYWLPNSLSADLEASGLSSCLGRKKGQGIDGIYTFGKNADAQTLLYTPLWNYFDVKVTPNPIRLIPATHTTAIASALAYGSASGTSGAVYTDLFAAAEGKLYYYPWDGQSDGAPAVLLLSNDILKDVISLYACSNVNKVTLWGLNEKGQIFYLECPTGGETDPGAWSYPLPILEEVIQMAFFVNGERDNSVLFAHIRTGALIQLNQDPVTTTWIQRSIVLPTTDIDDVLDVNTFTTQLLICGDDNLPAAGVSVSLTSTSPVTVYINDSYYHLHQDIPHEVFSDGSGNISIMQETSDMGAICYHLLLPDGTAADINPMTKMLDIMGTVKSGADLAAIEVSNADGSKQPLVPKDTSKKDLDETSQVLQKLVGIGGDMPADGSNQPGVASRRQVNRSYAFNAVVETIWGISYGDAMQYRDGAFALGYYREKYQTQDFLGISIKCIAGDVFNWMKDAWHDVADFFAHQIDGIWNFFIDIGGKLYNFVVNSINVVIRALEFVFNKIKVFIEDLIKWIGFLFQWKDILVTHEVLRNFILQFANYSIDQIGFYQDVLTDIFATLEEKINHLTGLPDIPYSISEYSAASSGAPEQNSPQANWGINQTKNNIGSSETPFEAVLGDSSKLLALLNELVDMLEREGQIFVDAINEIRTQIVDELTGLSVTELMKRLLGIISKVVMLSAENVVISVFNIVKLMIKGLVSVLEAPLRIPVISKLYKVITNGSELTMLDLICLVAAIPATVIYKAIKDEPPFPKDDPFTRALISAGSFQQIRDLYLGQGDDLVSNRAVRATTATFDSCAFVGSVFMIFWNAYSYQVATGAKQPSRAMGTAGVVFYLLYVLPNANSFLSRSPGPQWYADLNYGITTLSVVKIFIDLISIKDGVDPPPINGLSAEDMGIRSCWGKASPYIESGINLIWCIPPIMTLYYTAKEAGPEGADLKIPQSVIMSCTGNFAFNTGGILTPMLTWGNVAAAIGLAGMEASSLAYGVVSLISIPVDAQQ